MVLTFQKTKQALRKEIQSIQQLDNLSTKHQSKIPVQFQISGYKPDNFHALIAYQNKRSGLFL